MFCQECGTQVANDVKICPNCGFDFVKKVATDSNQGSQSEGLPPLPPPNTQRPAANSGPDPNLIYPKNPPNSPHLCWLSLLLPGVPHMVHGQVAKGILLLLLFFACIVTIFGVIVLTIIYTIDSYMVGKTLASGTPVGKWRCFPSPKN